MAALQRLAEFTDFESWPGVLVVDADTESVEFVLDCASAYIRAESGNETRWSEAGSVPVAIKAITVQVAARAWRNPTCASVLIAGPFQERFKSTVEDALFLTTTEKAIVSRLTARPKLWTIPTFREDEYLQTVLVPITGYLDPIPLDSWGNSGW